jgi:hypothetical protein
LVSAIASDKFCEEPYGVAFEPLALAAFDGKRGVFRCEIGASFVRQKAHIAILENSDYLREKQPAAHCTADFWYAPAKCAGLKSSTAIVVKRHPS